MKEVSFEKLPRSVNAAQISPDVKAGACILQAYQIFSEFSADTEVHLSFLLLKIHQLQPDGWASPAVLPYHPSVLSWAPPFFYITIQSPLGFMSCTVSLNSFSSLKQPPVFSQLYNTISSSSAQKKHLFLNLQLHVSSTPVVLKKPLRDVSFAAALRRIHKTLIDSLIVILIGKKLTCNRLILNFINAEWLWFSVCEDVKCVINERKYEKKNFKDTRK